MLTVAVERAPAAVLGLIMRRVVWLTAEHGVRWRALDGCAKPRKAAVAPLGCGNAKRRGRNACRF